MMTEEKTQAKGKKKKSSVKKSVIIPAVVLLAFLLAVLAFYAVPTIISSGRENISGFGNISSGDDHYSGYLFTAENGSVTSLNVFSDKCCALSGTSLISFNKKGSVSDVLKSGYSQPVVKFSKKNYVVFERSTGKYTVMDKDGSVNSGQLDGEIINADAADNGRCALLSRKTLSSTLLTVLSVKNEILFQWECNDGYPTECAISPNGKNVAVVVFDVINGSEKAKIYTFTVKSTQVENKFDAGKFVYSLDFLNNDTVCAVTDSKYFILNLKNGDEKTADYDYDTVSSCSLSSNGNMAVLKSAFGSLDKSTVTVYDRTAREILSLDFGEKVISFCADKSFLYVLTPCKITVYALSTGEEHSSIEVVGGLKYISALSGRIFCATDTDIYRYEK